MPICKLSREAVCSIIRGDLELASDDDILQVAHCLQIDLIMGDGQFLTGPEEELDEYLIEKARVKARKKRLKYLASLPKFRPGEYRDLERLTETGEWIPDDGQPGIAFSGLDPEGCPYAIYSRQSDRASYFDSVVHLASDRTCKRFGCSNGWSVDGD